MRDGSEPLVDCAGVEFVKQIVQIQLMMVVLVFKLDQR